MDGTTLLDQIRRTAGWLAIGAAVVGLAQERAAAQMPSPPATQLRIVTPLGTPVDSRPYACENAAENGLSDAPGLIATASGWNPMRAGTHDGQSVAPSPTATTNPGTTELRLVIAGSTAPLRRADRGNAMDAGPRSAWTPVATEPPATRTIAPTTAGGVRLTLHAAGLGASSATRAGEFPERTLGDLGVRSVVPLAGNSIRGATSPPSTGWMSVDRSSRQSTATPSPEGSAWVPNPLR